MTCNEIQQRLGELVDGELGAPLREVVQEHLEACSGCRAECNALRDLGSAIGEGRGPGEVPRDQLWQAIEQRLETASAVTSEAPQSLAIRWRLWRPLASAAAVLLTVGLGWLVVSAPWNAPAYGGQIDFRPLLEQAGNDIQAGIDELIRVHGGRAIARPEAEGLMEIRIQAADRLPNDLVLKSLYLLNLGRDHRALGFHYQGPNGHLLLLQCPPEVSKDYGGQECLPCHLGPSKGGMVRVGALRLAHFESENVCVCVVSTLDEADELPAVLDAVKIDF